VSSVEQTPWLRNTSSFANSSEHRKYVDDVLKEELGPLYVGIPGFYEKFFGEISSLTEISVAMFRECQEGNDPLFCTERGWRDWPKSAQERDVLKWIAKQIELFLDFAKDYDSAPNTPRRPLARPNMPLQGSTAERKLDIGFVDDPKAASADLTCHWSQILVPGELKSNPSLDTASKAWLDLGRYIREVLAAQDTRRFCLGFTICGSVMRLWEFDRVGGIASPPFDINKDGQQFVSVMLGFLWMNQEQLGFDPTIVHLHRALRQAGMNHAVAIPKPFLTLDAKGKRLTFCRFISEWDILDWCRVIFYDEAAIKSGWRDSLFRHSLSWREISRQLSSSQVPKDLENYYRRGY
jgi:hypothetical protein